MSSGVRSEAGMKGNFLKFLWYVWKYVLFLPPPTPIQYDISRYLVDGPKRRMIQAFRGVGKSFITATYIVWRLWRDPDEKIMVVSANEVFASEIAAFIKLIIASIPFLIHLKAKPGQRDSSLVFDVGAAKPDKSPSVKAVGITGQLTGSRASIILFDDVEVPKNSETETMREKLEAKTKEGSAVLKPGGEIIYLGTPQTEESIYRKLPSKGYDVRIWPGRYPLHKDIPHYNGMLAPILAAAIEDHPELSEPTYGSLEAGAPTDPDRFDEQDLMEREMEYGKAGFMLQFMLDTRLADADKYPLKLRDFVVFDIDNEIAPVKLTWATSPDLVLKDIPNVGFEGDRLFRPMYVSQDYDKYDGSVMVIDPSGRGADETAFVVTKMSKGRIFLTRWGGLMGGYSDEVLETLCLIAKEQGVNKVIVEANFGDGMFLKLLSPVLSRIYPVTLEEIRVSGQKERRIIDTIEPVLQQHRLVVSPSEIRREITEQPDNVYRLLYQLTHITRDRGCLKHDDRLDALAIAVSYWVEHMKKDIQKNEEEHQNAITMREVKEFLSSGTSIGGRRGRPKKKSLISRHR